MILFFAILADLLSMKDDVHSSKQNYDSALMGSANNRDL